MRPVAVLSIKKEGREESPLSKLYVVYIDKTDNKAVLALIEPLSRNVKNFTFLKSVEFRSFNRCVKSSSLRSLPRVREYIPV